MTNLYNFCGYLTHVKKTYDINKWAEFIVRWTLIYRALIYANLWVSGGRRVSKRQSVQDPKLVTWLIYSIDKGLGLSLLAPPQGVRSHNGVCQHRRHSGQPPEGVVHRTTPEGGIPKKIEKN